MIKVTFSPGKFLDVLPNIIARVGDLNPNKQYVIEIKEVRQRRSLDANAYCWTLLDKLSVELSKDGRTEPPEAIYRRLISDVGGNSELVPIRTDAIAGWERIWGANRIGWTCKDLGPCRKLDDYHYIKCFYGSSVYDNQQMSRLIDLVVQECEQVGIETATPQELERLKEEWR